MQELRVPSKISRLVRMRHRQVQVNLASCHPALPVDSLPETKQHPTTIPSTPASPCLVPGVLRETVVPADLVLALVQSRPPNPATTPGFACFRF